MNSPYGKHPDEIRKEQNQYSENIVYSQSIDELFDNALVDKASLSEADLADYRYYCEKLEKFDEEFKKFSKQFVWGVDESKWPTDLETRKKWRNSSKQYKQDLYDDFFSKNVKDDQFVRGADLSRYMEPDNDVVTRAGNMIKAKQREYGKMSAVGRFFSYLNPFKNEYRDMRNEIAGMKKKLIEKTGLDEKRIDDYAHGKINDLEYTKRDGYDFDTVSNCLQSVEVSRSNPFIEMMFPNDEEKDVNPEQIAPEAFSEPEVQPQNGNQTIEKPM